MILVGVLLFSGLLMGCTETDLDDSKKQNGDLTSDSENVQKDDEIALSEELKEVDSFAREVRTTVMKMEDMISYCNGDKETDEIAARQMKSIDEELTLLNETLINLCNDEIDEPTYFNAIRGTFFVEQLDNIDLDESAELELIVMIRDLRTVIDYIYPVNKYDTIFNTLGDWDYDDLKISNTEEFCQAATDKLYGELPTKISEGSREIDSEEYEIREGELPPTG